MKLIKQFTSYYLFFLICSSTHIGFAQDSTRVANLSPQTKPIVLDSSFKHDKWQTEPVDIRYDFAAFTTSFDSDDPTFEGGKNSSWGIPEWVAFEIQAGASKPNCGRPSPWLTDITLNEDSIAPNDNTYKVSGTKALNIVSSSSRYVRGHMCPFATAARITCDAAYNTCTVLNAVPQLQWQNNGIWKELEKNCTDWADKHNKIWVICGPAFFNKEPAVWLGQKEEVKAAVPDALYKIIIRENSTNSTGVETIAFIIPNIVPKDKELKEFVTNIEQIESLTGITFLNTLTTNQQLAEKVKNGIPPLPIDYDSMTSSEKTRAKNKRKVAFYKSNKKLIKSWLD